MRFLYSKAFFFLCFCFFSQILSAKDKVSRDFEFELDGNVFRGKVEYLKGELPTKTIFIVPGSGRTSFSDSNNFYSGVINRFVDFGLAVCFWDKAGCGNSDGVYDNQQPVQDSALEIVAAIRELKKQDAIITKGVGLWGISRGGWICPLVIEQYPVDFWIGVSGTGELDNYRYLLASNWPLKGCSKDETDLLLEEWDYLLKAITGDGISYAQCMDHTQHLFSNPFYNSLGGTRPTEEEYLDLKAFYKDSGFEFDSETGLQIMIEDFPAVLEKVNCPVLAIFGEKDTKVDWRNTQKLYERTMGENQSLDFTMVTIPNCNHEMQKCDTGEFAEDLSKYQWKLNDDYLNLMQLWLKERGIIQ